MFQKGDEEHIEVMNGMRELMSDPEAMKKWMEGKRKEFEALPEQLADASGGECETVLLTIQCTGLPFRCAPWQQVTGNVTI